LTASWSEEEEEKEEEEAAIGFKQYVFVRCFCFLFFLNSSFVFFLLLWRTVDTCVMRTRSVR
jgi:hypothetical protein